MGANVGDPAQSATGAPTLVGRVERIVQEAEQRDVMIRLDEPGPGMALVGSYNRENRHARPSAFSTTATVEETAAREGPQ